MFNQEQYAILKRCSEQKNISEWNNYRAAQPETRINLQNADLRRADLERADLRRANLEGTILPEGAEEYLSGLREEVEAIIKLIDDITYEEFSSLIKCLGKLSLIVGSSLPYLNEVRISRPIEEHAAWAGTEMDNMISINIPKNVAENLHGILHVGITAGQVQTEVTKAETSPGKKDLQSCGSLQKTLINAGFSEDERKAVLENLRLPKMQEDRLMEDLGIVAKLVECGRIYFQV